MKKDIKHIFWMLLCLFTIVACSDENHEMLITGPKSPNWITSRLSKNW